MDIPDGFNRKINEESDQNRQEVFGEYPIVGEKQDKTDKYYKYSKYFS